MSERTTIGGIVYEAIGSSSSNLLLKCNGTARIQWGSKLIDLIKNGKIASGDSLELIFIIKDESEIKSDGIYLLTNEESSQLWLNKDGVKYNLTDTNLYISASKPLNLTVEQKKQALDNIGILYNTLADVQKANIQNGIVYVIDTLTLYTIKDGAILEFEAKLKTVTVEKENNEGEVINSSVKIVLSILDKEYLVLADLRITANYSIHVKNSAQIGSESADKAQGYRLYIEGDTSYLDVDEINVRNGIKVTLYKEITFEELRQKINLKTLEPKLWYLLTDFQNHWKLPILNNQFNRPILVKAYNENTLYERGYLFKDHNVEIHYDPTYLETISQSQSLDGTGEIKDIIARGRITWMKDRHNNEANFDFLDYIDCFGNELAYLHYIKDFDTEEDKLLYDKSIFPKNSHNNKLITYDLKGTVLKNKIVDNSNTNSVSFLFDDSLEGIEMSMYNNSIECRGLITTCNTFCNNDLKLIVNLLIEDDFYNNKFTSIYSKPDLSDITENFSEITNNSSFTLVQFITPIHDVKCLEFKHSLLYSELTNCTFRNIKNCTFNVGTIKDVVSYCDLDTIVFDEITYGLLYITEKRKEMYLNNKELLIICIPESIFYRGMIVMHSGLEDIPDGWAICDGGEYEWNGVISKTPNLINRFVKAVATVEEIKETDNPNINENGEITLLDVNLPEHHHPHIAHTHTFSGSGSALDSFNALTSSSEGTVITAIEEGTEGNAITSVTSSEITVYDGNVAISGITSSEFSLEDVWQYGEPQPIKIEPNYFSLIFIMKL